MKQHFTLYIVSPAGYVHSMAFLEVAQGLWGGLRELGYQTSITTDPNELQGRVIVLGANLLDHHGIPGLSLPQDAVLLNLEQITKGSPWITDALLKRYSEFRVWDYSKNNVKALYELGCRDVHYVGIGYAKLLSRIRMLPENDRDIDVLFYGSLNERRSKILKGLQDKGLKVVHLFGVYGDQRDEVIARSKIVLNIHFYSSKIFEIVRLSYLLSNRAFIVSEHGSDPMEEAPYSKGLVLCEYEQLIDTCVKWIDDESGRRARAFKGFRVMKSNLQSKLLEAALQNGA